VRDQDLWHGLLIFVRREIVLAGNIGNRVPIEGPDYPGDDLSTVNTEVRLKVWREDLFL